MQLSSAMLRAIRGILGGLYCARRDGRERGRSAAAVRVVRGRGRRGELVLDPGTGGPQPGHDLLSG